MSTACGRSKRSKGYDFWIQQYEVPPIDALILIRVSQRVVLESEDRGVVGAHVNRVIEDVPVVLVTISVVIPIAGPSWSDSHGAFAWHNVGPSGERRGKLKSGDANYNQRSCRGNGCNVFVSGQVV